MTHGQLFILFHPILRRISNRLSQNRIQNPKSHFFFDAKDSSSFRKTSQSVLRLNSAAYQESLVAPSPQQTPPGDRKGLLCGISLRVVIKGWLLITEFNDV